MANRERMERLKNLSPIDAVRAWLQGDFGFGEEFVLCIAIRRDPRVTAGGEEIAEITNDALDDECDADETFARLVTSHSKN